MLVLFMFNIRFLGTSSMSPTKSRNQQAIFISVGSEGILIDCGDGTQNRFKAMGVSLTKITKILITHWHGDHVFGLPGVVQSLNNSEYSKTLEIYGPIGTKKNFSLMLKTFPFDKRIKINVIEVSSGTFFKNKKIFIAAIKMKHAVPTLAYSIVESDKRRINLSYVKKMGIFPGPLLGALQNNMVISWKGKKIRPCDATSIIKGKKVVVILDTLLNPNCYSIAKNADLLICESSFDFSLANKAKEYLHLTNIDAATIAKRAKCKKLILTHFSNRYKDVSIIKKGASKKFKGVVCAEDFMTISV